MSSPLVVLAALVLVAAATSPSRSAAADGYQVRGAAAAAELLLRGDALSWEPALAVSWGSDIYATTFRALWGVEGLFLRFDAVDPSPWHTLTERDDHLWTEEVVEIFIDPDGDGRNYAEIEINPHNAVCDLVIFTASPNLRSDIDWDHEGIRPRVVPLRDDAGNTVGWTAVALLPWHGFAMLPDSDGVTLPPVVGDAWRFNVFRIKRPGGPGEPAKDAVYAPWSPTSGPSFHDPAAFRPLEFTE